MADTCRIKIVSDGTPFGTRVYDADDKEIKGCITAIEWGLSTEQVATAKITFAAPIVELVSEVKDG
jgi:hypothetical protein